MFFWAPFTSFALYTLFGIVWRAYAEPLNMVVRIRYIYALLIPAQIFMLVMTVPIATLSAEAAPFLSFFGLFGSAVIVSITAYFGAFPQSESRGRRFARALTLGFALVAVIFVATFAALMIGMVTAMGDALAAAGPTLDGP